MVAPARPVERQTVSLPTAFRVLGVSRQKGYDLVNRGAFPLPLIKLGSRHVVSKRALDALLDERKQARATRFA